MKKIIFLIFLIFVASSSAQAWPFGKKNQITQQPVKTEEVKKPTISEGRNVLSEIRKELTLAKEENSRLKVSLNKVSEQLKSSEAKTLEVQKAADDLREWGTIQQAEAQKFMEKYNAAVKRYHRLKLIAAFIAAGVGVLLGLQFMNLAPPPYNLGVPVGGAVLFASLVWFLL